MNRLAWLTLLLLSGPALLPAVPVQDDSVDLQPLVEPNLERMKPAIRASLQALSLELKQLLTRTDLSAEQRAEAFGRMGQYYQAHSLLEAAEPVLLNAHLLASREVRWPYLLAMLYRDKNQYQQAVVYYKKALELRPKDPYALTRLGTIQLQLNQPAQAMEQFKKAQDTAPAAAFVLQGLGMASAALNQPEAATHYLQKALEQQPTANALCYPLGLAYRKLGNMEKAKYYIEQHGEDKLRYNDPYLAPLSEIVTLSSLDVVLAMAAESETFSPRDFMGYIFTNLGSRMGLIEYLSDAFDDARNKGSKPHTLAHLQYAIGNLLGKEESYHDAIAAFDTAIQLEPDFKEPYLEKGFVLRQLGRYQQAFQLYNQLLAKNPNEGDALSGRALTALKMRKPRLALADLKRLTILEPERAAAQIQLGKLLLEDRDIKAARAVFESVLTKELEAPLQVEAHNFMGLIHQSSGAYSQALSHYETSLRLASGQNGTRANLAGTLALLGRFDEAIEHYELVLATEPANEAAHMGYLGATVMAGYYQDVVAHLEDAHQRLPDNLFLKHLLARFLAGAPDMRLRDGERSLKLVKQVLVHTEAEDVLETHAMALAQAGHYAMARRLQKSLIVAAENKAATALLTRLRANLNLYLADKPSRIDKDPALLLP